MNIIIDRDGKLIKLKLDSIELNLIENDAKTLIDKLSAVCMDMDYEKYDFDLYDVDN